jgi:pectate lyase
MYYGGVRSPPVPDFGAVLVVALVAASCDVRIYPLRGPSSRTDAALLPDASIPCPPVELVGFASMSDKGGERDSGSDDAAPMLWLDGGVTGGGAATRVVVDAADADALAQFTMYASDKMPGPLTIIVKGMITIPPTPDGGDTGTEQIRVSSNKTVIGANVDPNGKGGSGFYGGGLAMTKVSNVIIQNLMIARPNDDGLIDAIHIETSHQIWIDHCDLSSSSSETDAGASYDGLIDISDQSDFVTVSWTYYHDHGDSGLIGRSDSAAAAAEDAKKEHVTFDHDLFQNVRTGPRARFGLVHVLNNYFNGVANYGVAATDGANVRIDASSFRDVAPAPQPDADFGPVTTILDPPATAGSVYLFNNVLNTADGNGQNVIPPTQVVSWQPPYLYTPDSATNVPFLVTSCSGTGKITVPPVN